MNHFPRITTCFLLALLTLINTRSASAQSGAYTIKGAIAGTTPYFKVKLHKSLSSSGTPDSALIINGSFSFKGTIDHPSKGFIILYAKDSTAPQGYKYAAAEIYLEPGTITARMSRNPDALHISGTKLNDDNEKVGELAKSVNEKMGALNKSYASATPEQKKDTAFVADLQKKEAALENERQMIIDHFIAENPSNLLSFYLLEEKYNRMGAPGPDSATAELNKLAPSVRTSVPAKEFAAKLDREKSTAVGHMAPDFTQTDTAGKPVSLHDFRGKYVLVDFWASWCHPCRDENPNVVKAYNAFKDKNFTVIGVSFDNPGQKDKWMKAIHDDHLTWTQVSDLKSWDNEIGKRYVIQSIPQNFLVDPQGKIIAHDLRGEELEKKLTELFGG